MYWIILVVLCGLLTQLEAFTVQITNDTGKTHFLLFEKIGHLLNRGDHCTLNIPTLGWWNKFLHDQTIMLYRQDNNGLFSERFKVRPKGDPDDFIEISISDVHSHVKLDNVPYRVQVEKTTPPHNEPEATSEQEE